MENTINKKSGRLFWVDCAKAITMFCIVMGHILVKTPIQSIMYSFHVPAFIFLSGFCFSDKRSFLSFTINKFKKIMLPYFLYGLLAIGIYYLYERFYTGREVSVVSCLSGLLIGSVKSEKMYFNLHLWFLPALYVLSIAFYLLKKITDKLINLLKIRSDIIYVIITIILFSVTYFFLDYKVDSYLPWSADTAMRLLPFYSLGFTFSKYNKSEKTVFKKDKKTVVYIAIILALIILLIYSAWKNVLVSTQNDSLFMVNYIRDSYGVKYLYYISSVSGIIFTVILSKLIPQNKPVMYFGQNTLPVLGLQKFPIMAIRIFIDKITFSSSFLQIIFAVMLSVITILCCLLADKILKVIIQKIKI